MDCFEIRSSRRVKAIEVTDNVIVFKEPWFVVDDILKVHGNENNEITLIKQLDDSGYKFEFKGVAMVGQYFFITRHILFNG